MKVGKIEKINIEANKKLKKLYSEKGIYRCELRLPGCDNFFLQFAHRHKRIEYRSRPELLSDFNQTVLACNYCHSKIEKDKKLTEDVFLRLRGKDDIR